MNILIFSPSARMCWLTPEKSLNPSYWIITYLAVSLGRFANIYTCGSIKAEGRLKQYNNEHIDVVVSLGANYNPATLKCEFKADFPRHAKAFYIAAVTREVFARCNPLHINLCVDVRKWFPELTSMFGKEPDVYITEQEMKWQQIGFLCMRRVLHNAGAFHAKAETFFFSGGVKSRQDEFIEMTEGLQKNDGYPMFKIIHGGGWDKYLSYRLHYETLGFQQWKDSASCMIQSSYGCVLHEPLGNQQGWVTAKYFETLGAKNVCFISKQYDSNFMYIQANHPLRVESYEHANYLIKKHGYNDLMLFQSRQEQGEWLDLENFYTQPFLNQFKALI